MPALCYNKISFLALAKIMRPTHIHGSIPALITPFCDDGQVDFDALAQIIEWQVDCGTHALVATGTTGEAATLSVNEHIGVVDFVVKTVRGRIPVIAGTGANSTAEAIELTKRACDVGADAVLIVVPYYNKPPQEGLYQHFAKIARTVNIPQILYNVPSRTVADLHQDTLLRLSEFDNIVGIKDATGDIGRGKALLDALDGRLAVFSGDDASALDLVQLGAVGNISVTANVAPKQMAQAFALALAGKYNEAVQIYNTIKHLHRDLFMQTSPIPAKYALAKMGKIQENFRLPLVPLEESCRPLMDKALYQAGLI